MQVTVKFTVHGPMRSEAGELAAMLTTLGGLFEDTSVDVVDVDMSDY